EPPAHVGIPEDRAGRAGRPCRACRIRRACPAMSQRSDIAWSRQLARSSVGQVILWTSAAALAIVAHAGAAWWVMKEPPTAPADPGAPVAIMIDLAPVAMAPAAKEEQIASDVVDSVAAEAAPPPEEAEPVESVETAELAEPVPDEPDDV